MQFHRRHSCNHPKRQLSRAALRQQRRFAFGAATQMCVGGRARRRSELFRAIKKFTATGEEKGGEKNEKEKPRPHNGARKPSGHLCCDKNRFVAILLRIRLPKRDPGRVTLSVEKSDTGFHMLGGGFFLFFPPLPLFCYLLWLVANCSDVLDCRYPAAPIVCVQRSKTEKQIHLIGVQDFCR